MSTTTREITNYDDIIDSREIIARLEDLAGRWQDWANGGDSDQLDLDERAELDALTGLAEQAENGGVEDWQFGATLIRDSYFVDYAQELADDIGAIDSDAGWPMRHIDWEAAASELQMDYTAVDFDGVTYWVR